MRMTRHGLCQGKAGMGSGWMDAWAISIAILFAGLSAGWAGAPLTMEERIKAQESIERVYYHHRLWPKENPGPKPPFGQMIERRQIEAKVEEYLKKSAALEKIWHRPLSAGQLQAEMDRMARKTQDPDILRQLFASLNDDPHLIAECLVRPVLADRLVRNWYAQDGRWHPDSAADVGRDGTPSPRRDPAGAEFNVWWRSIAEHGSLYVDWQEPGGAEYRLPMIGQSATREDSPKGRWAFNSMSDALSGRTRHTAVWTGTEMIVWGGQGQSLLNSGARYDPATDIWTPMAKNGNCPEGRSYHAAVWTGTEMVVWGGRNDLHYLKTGGRYDPAKDEWFPITMGAYSATERSGHSAVWTGTEMIVWGGYNGRGCLFTGGRYDPRKDQWVSVASEGAYPEGRTAHTAVWTGSEMIVWGGWNGASRINSGGRYSPATDTWASVSTASYCPGPCSGHTAVWTGSRMIVWGGHIDDSPYRTDRGGVYDPVLDSWMPTPVGLNCPSLRAEHTAVWTGSEMIIWGGVKPSGDGLQDGARYDPAAAKWKVLGNDGQLPSGRMDHSAIWTGSEMIVWGGAFSWYNSPKLDTGGRYSPASDSWVATPTLVRWIEGREAHSAVWTGLEMFVWGGRNGFFYYKSGMKYAPATDSWSYTPAAPLDGRERHSAIWTGLEMIIWGGVAREEAADRHFQSGGRYDPSADSWKPMGVGPGCPSARALHSTVWTGTEMIVWGGSVKGGSQPATYFGDGGRYDPQADTWIATPQGGNLPGERDQHTAVWDGSAMIIWGGFGCAAPDCAVATPQGTGARLEPSAGAWVPIPAGPEARYLHSAVWTGREMIVWGGMGFGPALNTGGRYNVESNEWAPTTSATGCPSGRISHTTVWTGREMIVWGGNPELSVSPFDMVNTGGFYDPDDDEWTDTSTEDYCPSGRTLHSAVWTGKAMIIWGGYGPLSTGGILQVSSHIPPVAAP